MAVSTYLFGKAYANLLGGEIAGDTFAVDYLSDTIKCSLHTATYAPNLDTHETYANLTNEVANGNGYTTGGATLGTKAITYTAANSWATQWAGVTGYLVGDIVRPTAGNNHLYRCIVAGTTAAGAPAWPTVSGQTVADSGVTWAEIGRGLLQIDAADVSWPASTITARYGVIYRSGGGDPLLILVDFGQDFSSSNGTFQITWHTLGIWVHSTP